MAKGGGAGDHVNLGMSGADDRLTRFEAWAKENGSDVNVRERRRIAEELFAAVGAEPVRVTDVEALVKRYKDGLLGAQRVIAAQRVSQEVLEWQERDPTTADPVRPALSIPPVRGNADAETSQAPGPRVATWRRRASGEMKGVTSDAPPSGPPSVPPSGPTPADDAFPADAAPAEAPARDAPPAEAPAREAPPAEAPAKAAPRVVPPARPTPRDATSMKLAEAMSVDMEGIKPRARGSDAPPPSVATRQSERPPASYPIGARGAVPSRGAIRGRLPFVIGGAVVAVATIAALGIVVAKPSCLYSDPGRNISGVYRSKHLGLMTTFPADWRHAENLDASEPAKGGFAKKSEVFFRGTSATDYRVRIDVVSFVGEGDQPANDETARVVGGGEALKSALRRVCEPLVRGETRGTRCMSYVTPTGDPFEYATIEEYFPLGSGVVFVRGSFKIGADHPPADDAERRTAEEAPSVVAAQKEFETLVSTIDTIHD